MPQRYWLKFSNTTRRGYHPVHISYNIQNPFSRKKGFIFQNPLGGNSTNPGGSKSIPQLVNNIFDAIIQMGLVFVVMAIIYSGLQFVLAQGDPEKLKKARMVFLYTIIGGVILLGAGVISQVICNTANQFLTTSVSC